MNRNKTAQLLNEWKSFLSEGVKSTFTAQEAKDEIAVVVEDCCGSCGEKSGIDIPKKGSPKFGKLTSHDVNDIKIGDRTENLVMVKIGNSDPKKYPQCCVKRKSDSK